MQSDLSDRFDCRFPLRHSSGIHGLAIRPSMVRIHYEIPALHFCLYNVIMRNCKVKKKWGACEKAG
jgi:hypothetical protein